MDHIQPRIGSTTRRIALAIGAVLALQGCTVALWALGEPSGQNAESAPTPVPGSPGALPTPLVAPAAPAAPGLTDARAAAPPTPDNAGPAGGRADTSRPLPAARPGNAPSTAPVPGPNAAIVSAAGPDAQPSGVARTSGSGNAAGRAIAPGTAQADRRYVVQVGAFRVEASAHSVRDKVAAQLAGVPGLTAVDNMVRVVSGGNLFRVFVGRADDLATTSALAARLREALQQDAFVTRARD